MKYQNFYLKSFFNDEALTSCNCIPVSWGCRIHRQRLGRGVKTPTNEYPD